MTELNESSLKWTDIEDKLDDHWTCLKPLRGYTTNLEDVKKIINIFERCTNTSYIYLKQDKLFGKRETVKDLETCRIFFKDREGDKEVVGDDGIPFPSLGSMVLGCHLGMDKHRKEKDAKKEIDEYKAKGDHVFLKKRKYVQDTKKKECKATIYVKEVLKFPQFKLSSDSKEEKNCSSLKIKKSVARQDIGSKRFYILLPPLDAHEEYHSTSKEATLFNPIHPMIRDKIHGLVGEGVSRVSEMRRHINMFVKTSLAHEHPSPEDRRYFPTNRDIRNHIYCTQIKNRYSKIDQVNLKFKVEEWRREFPEDTFKYRSCRDDPGMAFTEDLADELHELKQSLLFCHQTVWQKRLLSRYGNEICFLDATYRTTRYSIPLFFLVVKTNVGYTVVGSFAVQNETKEAVKEALQQFKEWNPTWTPSFFLTDFSEVEIQAIEDVFQGIKERILTMMRRIARATCVDRYHEALKTFKHSPEWHGSNQLQKWYTNQWEPVYKRWVWAFRKDRLNCKLNTNNGIERQNRTFKNSYLAGYKNNSLSGMFEVMITVFLPEKYQEYIKDNVRGNEEYGKTYSKNIPDYLRNRPKYFIVHCMNKLHGAETLGVISDNADGTFNVGSSLGNSKSYMTTLDYNGVPSCTCMDWQISHLPCKHMMCLILHGRRSWSDFADSYIHSPMFTLDMESSSCQSVPKVSASYKPREVVLSGKDLPNTPRKSLNQVKLSCRELLTNIKDLTFLCHNHDALLELGEKLRKAKESLERNVCTEDGLLVYPKENTTRKRPNRQRSTLNKKRKKKEGEEMKSVFMKLKDYISSLSREEWQHIKDSELTSIGGRRAAVILEEEDNKEEEFLEVVKKSMPFDMEDRQLVDLLFKLTAKLVENGIIHIENDPATTDKDADIAMQALVSDLASGDCKNQSDFLLQELTMPKATDLPKGGSRFHVCGEVLESTDLRSVLKQNWLTDKIINAFLKMTMMNKNRENSGHIYVLPSYLAVLWERGCIDTWLYKKVHLSLFEWIFLPININNNHWTLAAHVPSSTVSLLDSISNARCQEYILKWRSFMAKRAEFVQELGSWREGDLKSERQQDGHSCGLYVLLNALVLVRGQTLDTVTMAHIREMRNYVFHSLMAHAESPPSQRTRCDMLECKNPRSRDWVCCDVCGRWCHKICVNLSTNLKEDSVCPICNAQYA